MENVSATARVIHDLVVQNMELMNIIESGEGHSTPSIKVADAYKGMATREPLDDILYDAVYNAMKLVSLRDAAARGGNNPFRASDLAHTLVVPHPSLRDGDIDVTLDESFLESVIKVKQRVNAARRALAAAGHSSVYGRQILHILDA